MGVLNKAQLGVQSSESGLGSLGPSQVSVINRKSTKELFKANVLLGSDLALITATLTWVSCCTEGGMSEVLIVTKLLTLIHVILGW